MNSMSIAALLKPAATSLSTMPLRKVHSVGVSVNVPGALNSVICPCGPCSMTLSQLPTAGGTTSGEQC